MRKLAVSTFILAVAVTLPLHARGKNESYISYDDGGTVVRQGDDNNREIDARVNLPVFPGDEVITNRRGRTEVRLADGNVLGIDRATSILFRSILDSYDTDGNDTIAELRYGKVAIYRVSDATESLRLDTPSASYFAGSEAVFSVESDSHGRDHLAVFQGSIEVRTPAKTSRVRAGESAEVDDRGLYDLVNDEQTSADDFERWFLQRSEKFGNSNSRYLDRSLAYSDDDLAHHGSWTFISGFGWGWRPFVGAGWRPYYNGQWSTGPSGCLTWVSYEPWGWVPYHYGRWSFDPAYGWFWLPGSAYSPAWVYWMYSPGYIGWAPAGWYDCYRPYYDWAYRPYARAGLDFGFGFYGRVRVNEIDLRPWTFVDANTIVSGRIDRAAIGIDIVRGRLVRGPADLGAMISGSPAKFGRSDLRDPAGAVNEIYRRGLTGATGQVVPATDMTPFFRRDNELPAVIRDRFVRTHPVDGVIVAGRTPAVGGSVAPIGAGSVAPIGSGSLAPIGRGGVAPTTGGSGNTPTPSTGGNDGRIHRGDGGDWRNNGGGSSAPAPAPRDSGSGRVHRDTTTPDQSWRGRVNHAFPAGVDGGDRPSATTPAQAPGETPAPAPNPSGRTRATRSGSSDVPRRVIDGIGGTRIYRGDGDRSSPPPPRAQAPRPPAHESAPPPPPAHHDSGNHDSGAKRDSGSHSSSSGEKPHKDKS
ncbi:MAG TPA: DUF6600 domain-containing protein [Thermoanaerobaculia bacterium]